ncbi:Protein of unknown function, partial [Cotesia congregata]
PLKCHLVGHRTCNAELLSIDYTQRYLNHPQPVGGVSTIVSLGARGQDGWEATDVTGVAGITGVAALTGFAALLLFALLGLTLLVFPLSKSSQDKI